jgi:hypothetical protein
MKKINYLLLFILFIVIILFIIKHYSIKDGLAPPMWAPPPMWQVPTPPSVPTTSAPTTSAPTTSAPSKAPSIPLYKYFLDSPYGLMCLDGTDNNISMRPCNNSTEQQWYKGNYDNEYTTFMNNKTHNCLDIMNDGQNNKLITNGCNNSPGQIWRSPPTNKQFKVFKSMLTDPNNTCLDGTNGSLLMKPCNGSSNQNWNTDKYTN